MAVQGMDPCAPANAEEQQLLSELECVTDHCGGRIGASRVVEERAPPHIFDLEVLETTQSNSKLHARDLRSRERRARIHDACSISGEPEPRLGLGPGGRSSSAEKRPSRG